MSIYNTYRSGTEAAMLAKEAEQAERAFDEFASSACDVVESLENDIEENDANVLDLEEEVGELKAKIKKLEELPNREKVLSEALLNIGLYVNEILKKSGVWSDDEKLEGNGSDNNSGASGDVSGEDLRDEANPENSSEWCTRPSIP